MFVSSGNDYISNIYNILLASIEQLHAYSYQPQVPYLTNNGWSIYDPIKEYERMGIGSSDKWRFTIINRDYKVTFYRDHCIKFA